MAGVLLYGSHLLNAAPDKHSAYDFVVVVDAYAPFYSALKRSGAVHRPAWLFTAAARILPPNVIAFTPDEGREGMAKCLVVSRRDLARALGPRPPDHFLLARLIQKVALVWQRTADDGEWIEARLEEARDGVLGWVAPYLEEPFDAEAVGRTILQVCYRGELRPEAKNRSETIFLAQRDHFTAFLEEVLARAAGDGLLVPDPGGGTASGYRFAARPGLGRRLRIRWYFARSKTRITVRWLKHVLTFDNWLPYIARKVERRMGTPVELTPLERRFPLVFLWPRVFRTLRSRPRRESLP